MTDEETEEAKIGKADREIRRKDGLEGPADSPEIGNLAPALAPGEKRDDHRNHRPVAELQRERLLPDEQVMPEKENGVTDVVRDQHDRETNRDREIDPLRVR